MSSIVTHTLSNGLRVVIQPVADQPIAVCNVMYHVGSINEEPQKTGLAHFLEHVMFGGSANAPSYDEALHAVGGENNAYTSQDVTNYWCKLPASNIEFALWLEADRLCSPSYQEKVIETQRKVVKEEFRQGYHNQPYGDVWHLLLSQAYQKHPYRWPVIGKNLEHIDATTQEDMVTFGKRFYTPNNAVLTVVGGVVPGKVLNGIEKWFGSISPGVNEVRFFPKEVVATESSVQRVVRDVPQNALYKTYHLPERTHVDYILVEALAMLLAGGRSSLLWQQLVEEQGLFSEIHAETSGDMEGGLLLLRGKLQDHVTFEKAEESLQALLQRSVIEGISARALQKVKNQEVASYLLDNIALTAQANRLAYEVLLGGVGFFNQELSRLQQVQSVQLQEVAATILAPSNGHALYYAKG